MELRFQTVAFEYGQVGLYVRHAVLQFGYVSLYYAS